MIPPDVVGRPQEKIIIQQEHRNDKQSQQPGLNALPDPRERGEGNGKEDHKGEDDIELEFRVAVVPEGEEDKIGQHPASQAVSRFPGPVFTRFNRGQYNNRRHGEEDKVCENGESRGSRGQDAVDHRLNRFPQGFQGEARPVADLLTCQGIVSQYLALVMGQRVLSARQCQQCQYAGDHGAVNEKEAEYFPEGFSFHEKDKQDAEGDQPVGQMERGGQGKAEGCSQRTAPGIRVAGFKKQQVHTRRNEKESGHMDFRFHRVVPGAVEKGDQGDSH